MEDDTWIKLYRKLLKSPIFDNEKALKIWIWCLLKVTYTDKQQLVGRQIIELKSGQFVFGRKKASLELKMNESTIYKYMKILEELQMINVVSNNKFSIVSIEKWGDYQIKELKEEQQSNNKEKLENNNKRTAKNVEVEEIIKIKDRKNNNKQGNNKSNSKKTAKNFTNKEIEENINNFCNNKRNNKRTTKEHKQEYK